MIDLRPIRPPPGTLDPKKYKAALRMAQGIAETAALTTARGTTRGWRHRVTWRIERKGDDQSDVVTDDEIFFYQDQGTKPHVIRPKRKRALSWPSAAHPVRRVNHPGTPAQRFTDTIAATMRKQYQRIVAAELEKAAR